MTIVEVSLLNAMTESKAFRRPNPSGPWWLQHRCTGVRKGPVLVSAVWLPGHGLLRPSCLGILLCLGLSVAFGGCTRADGINHSLEALTPRTDIKHTGLCQPAEWVWVVDRSENMAMAPQRGSLPTTIRDTRWSHTLRALMRVEASDHVQNEIDLGWVLYPGLPEDEASSAQCPGLREAMAWERRHEEPARDGSPYRNRGCEAPTWEVPIGAPARETLQRLHREVRLCQSLPLSDALRLVTEHWNPHLESSDVGGGSDTGVAEGMTLNGGEVLASDSSLGTQPSRMRSSTRQPSTTEPLAKEPLATQTWPGPDGVDASQRERLSQQERAAGHEGAPQRAVVVVTNGEITPSCDGSRHTDTLLSTIQSLADRGVSVYPVGLRASRGGYRSSLNDMACAGNTAWNPHFCTTDAEGLRRAKSDNHHLLFHPAADADELASVLERIALSLSCQ